MIENFGDYAVSRPDHKQLERYHVLRDVTLIPQHWVP